MRDVAQSAARAVLPRRSRLAVHVYERNFVLREPAQAQILRCQTKVTSIPSKSSRKLHCKSGSQYVRNRSQEKRAIPRKPAPRGNVGHQTNLADRRQSAVSRGRIAVRRHRHARLRDAEAVVHNNAFVSLDRHNLRSQHIKLLSHRPSLQTPKPQTPFASSYPATTLSGSVRE